MIDHQPRYCVQQDFEADVDTGVSAIQMAAGFVALNSHRILVESFVGDESFISVFYTRIEPDAPVDSPFVSTWGDYADPTDPTNTPHSISIPKIVGPGTQEE